MKIYVSHSTKFDYQKQLYEVLRNQKPAKHTFILPHENKVKNSKKTIQSADLVLAEVSYPSLGQGIELGWAETFKVPIIAIYQKGKKFGSSLRFVTTNIYQYSNVHSLQKIIEKI